MPLSIPVATAGGNRAQRGAIASEARHLRPRFVSVRQACNYLGVSRSTLYAKLLSRVKIIAIGRRRLIDFGSLEALADELAASSEEAES
jgi:excisionase family DNA binding protein